MINPNILSFGWQILDVSCGNAVRNGKAGSLLTNVNISMFLLSFAKVYNRWPSVRPL